MSKATLALRAGDLVEVRTAGEILGTLDADGTLDALPFMPEMLEFCGRRFRVFRKVEKTYIDVQLALISQLRRQ